MISSGLGAVLFVVICVVDIRCSRKNGKRHRPTPDTSTDSELARAAKQGCTEEETHTPPMSYTRPLHYVPALVAMAGGSLGAALCLQQTGAEAEAYAARALPRALSERACQVRVAGN